MNRIGEHVRRVQDCLLQPLETLVEGEYTGCVVRKHDEMFTIEPDL